MGRRRMQQIHRATKYPTQAEVLAYINKPVKEQTMETKRVAPRTLRRLDAGEYFRVYKWIEAQTFEPGVTRAKVASMASADLGMEVADVHISSALKTMGLSLPTLADPEGLVDRVRKLEEQVAYLMERINWLNEEANNRIVKNARP